MLDAILQHKRAEIQRLPEVSEDEARPCDRDFRTALMVPGLSFITEIKRRSPSGGDLAPNADPAAQAMAYVAGGCAAISVLTDARFFGGSFDDLARVAAIVPVPVLCKDFILDERQVRLARKCGAAACLLIAAALPDSDLRSLIEAVRLLRMTPLVEVHDETELARAIEAGADVIGVNNRNLQTMMVDLTTVSRLAPRVPSGRVLVAESGYDSEEALRRLPNRADAVLIGSALMRSADPTETLRGWRAALETEHTRPERT